MPSSELSLSRTQQSVTIGKSLCNQLMLTMEMMHGWFFKIPPLLGPITPLQAATFLLSILFGWQVLLGLQPG